MNGSSSSKREGIKGRVGLHAAADLDGLTALRSYAPLVTPIICETPSELFDLLDSEAIDLAFIGVGDGRSGAVLDTYTSMAKRDVTIIGEHVQAPGETRFLLVAKGQWRNNGRRFRPDRQAGDLWLDLPVLSQGRTSLVFELPHEPGALVRALGPISRRHLNVSKLEMRPFATEGEGCTIAAEIDGYAHEAPLKAALDELNRLASGVHVLGAYPAAS